MATTKATTLAHNAEIIDDLGEQSVPHIILGVLYPAVGGNDIHGTDIDTSHGSTYTYGELHTDGRKYYYTDIKGSKPIKDPRIGGHFGSQRHKFKSLQLLEQETATHGKNIYSADGRKWVRFVDGNNVWRIDNDGNGVYPIAYTDCTNNFVEITGYFNDINFALGTATNRPEEIDISVNGTLSVDGSTTLGGDTTVGSPLLGRYVDSGSLINGGTTLSNSLGTTPKINTIKYEIKSGSGKYLVLFGIELIAQDTTSTANRSKIQIPSQDVVSYGKKFTVSGTPHYDPFNGFTSGSSVTSYIDTATSLGVEKWKNSSTYYRPYNGGRVVKWVDSSGVIKTSVTLMPPNAKSIGDSSSLTNATAKANASASNDTFYPTFEAHTTDVNEDLLHEVAKTFHVREFGNGSANGGTGAANYADVTMLTGTVDDIAYVMDDGLTSLSGDDVHVSSENFMGSADGDGWYVTFIGTGISFTSGTWGAGIHQIAQNLPYGTHILKCFRDSDTHPVLTIDGVNVQGSIGTYSNANEITFHQPKRPPIPEDACILADFMLMADFVPQSSAGVGSVSKGSRIVDCSRDLFYDASSGSNGIHHAQVSSGGFKINSNTTASAGVYLGKVPAFGTNFLWKGYDVRTRGQLKVNGSNATQTDTTGGSFGHVGYITSGSEPNLGVNTFEATNKASQELMIEHFEIATPTHSSHHYQPFESPLLHELIGGDRNMEQTNLVVSPDGKSWDEVTRDKSYLASDLVLSATTDTSTGWSTTIVFDEWRGKDKNKARFNKDSWAIAYDRLICLKDGTYEMFTSGAFDSHQDIYVNGTDSLLGANGTHSGITLISHMKRGDYIQVKGDFGSSNDIRYGHFFIKRVN